MKIKAFLLLIILAITLVGCASEERVEATTTPAPTTDESTTDESTTDGNYDAVSSASIVYKEADFEKAISKDGTWIIATLKDLSFEKDLVLDGNLKNDKGEIQRKIALYTQDENRVVTNRFTLKAPKLRIKSDNSSIQHGTFKGDIYVETTDFQLVDVKVDGNIYFITEEAKLEFTMDEESSVTGKQEVIE